MCLSITMLKHCEVKILTKKSTSSLAASHVRASALPGKEKEKMTTDTSGRSSRGWSESLGQLGLWLRMYLESSILPQTTFARIWSAKVTPSGFFIMKLRLSELPTVVRESFLWRTPDAHCNRGAQSPERFTKSMKAGKLLTLNDQVAHFWATPKASDATTGATARQSDRVPAKTTHLAAQVHLFPTPRAADGVKGQRTRKGTEKEMCRGHGIDLPMFAQLYPTPTVRGNSNRKGSSSRSGNGLATFVKQMFPTPTVNDSKNNNPPSQHTENGRNSNPLNVVAGGALNPAWVEWLMGFPPGWTELGGSTSPIFQESHPEGSPTECNG
jgi:hypothetical protein